MRNANSRLAVKDRESVFMMIMGRRVPPREPLAGGTGRRDCWRHPGEKESGQRPSTPWPIRFMKGDGHGMREARSLNNRFGPWPDHAMMTFAFPDSDEFRFAGRSRRAI